MGANSPYFEFSKVDDVGVVEAADFEGVETGFANVDTDKANKVIPGTTGDLATLTAAGDLGDSGKTPPSGEIVGTTDTQTLANKTLTQPAVNTGTLNNSVFTGSQTEDYYEATGAGTALDPALGVTWDYTINANATFTDSLSDGEWLWLEISGGDTYTVSWPSITWVAAGAAPALTSEDLVILWKKGTELRAFYVGTAV